MGDEPCGVSWEEIAASAYRAYAASTGGKNFRGEMMPAWAALPEPIRVAWEAATRQVGACVQCKIGQSPPDEQRWFGWLPPR